MPSPEADASVTDSTWLQRIVQWLAPSLLGALAGLLMRLLYSGKPGSSYHAMMVSFAVLVPILVGALAVYLAERIRRRSWAEYFWLGAGANTLFVIAALLTSIEGLICAVLAVPLFGFIGGLGGLLMGALCRRTNWPRRALYSFASLPLLLGGLEQHFPLPNVIHTTERILIVPVTPAQLWPQLGTANDIQPEEIGNAWMYRIGVPLPRSAVAEGFDGKVVRHITMGRGVHFDQVATEWEPDRRVRWQYHFSKDSFPPGALDDHVRIGGEHFDVLDTEYVLRPVAGGTELTARMSYRVSTPFNWYALPIAEFLVGNFESAALQFYSNRAQRPRGP